MANDEDDPFPILQLPLTMKDMVLPKLSVLDLYNLSLVSDEAKIWVKNYVKNKNYRLKIGENWDYEVSLLNSDNQGFDVTFDGLEGNANCEFYFGDFSVLTKKEVTAPNRIKIRVLTERLDAQWEQNKAMKSFIIHLTDVFTRDVCIHISNSDDARKEKIIMNLVKNQNLNVHCYSSYKDRTFARSEEYPKCKRMHIENGNINARKMKSFFDEWLINGNMDYFEVRNLPKDFNIDYIMGAQKYTTTPIGYFDWARSYTVTRADGITATVKFTPGYTVRLPPRLDSVYWHPNIVIKFQTDQKYSTCF